MGISRRWLIGRAPECQVVCTAPGVSWHHCTLTQLDETFTLEDLQSSNGTYVNDKRITAPAPVRPEDKITLGLSVPMPWPNVAAPAAGPATEFVLADWIPPRIERILRIGRGPDNDLVLDFPMVSSSHARVLWIENRMILEDVGSSNGTAIGDPANKIQRCVLNFNDVIFFGTLRVPIARLLRQITGLGRQPHSMVHVGPNAMMFGRDKRADRVLHDPTVSWRHARLSPSPLGILLEDLNSSNGTYVNGRRIRGKMTVHPGDVIGIGSYTFTLTDAGEIQERDFRGNLTLEARGISVAVKDKRLLDDVSLTICPSEFVGLMGPSGAGKTTLMNALNGYATPVQGQVLLNGQDLAKHYRQFALFLGYVPQDDIIHRDLTVGQALYFSARLRLPSDFSDADIADRIKDVVKQLGLEGTENVLIGSPEKRGISGGQRKRVNLAMELLIDPLVLFLDEPTSGLSSEDALVVMKVLRDLANDGKTILLTIHQPSLEVYQLLDNLVLVAKDTNSAAPGQLAYYGPAYPDAIRFFNPAAAMNALPDDIFKGLRNRSAEEWNRQYKISTYCQEYVVKRADQSQGDPDSGPPRRASVSFFHQCRILIARCLTIKIKDRLNTAILLTQAPAVAILIVLVLGKQTGETVTQENWPAVSRDLGTTLFLMTLAALWFGASNAVREIVGEWAIYVRERMVNLSIPAYLTSKFTVLGALAVVQCAFLVLITAWGCNLQGSWLLFFCLLLLAATIGIAIGLLLSAVVRTSEMAIALLPIVLLALIVLGGGMKPIHTMFPVTQWLCALNPARWTFEGMVVTEAGQRPRFDPPPQAKDQVSKDMADHYFPEKTHRATVRQDLLCLGIHFTVLAGAILLTLKLRDVRK